MADSHPYTKKVWPQTTSFDFYLALSSKLSKCLVSINPAHRKKKRRKKESRELMDFMKKYQTNY